GGCHRAPPARAISPATGDDAEPMAIREPRKMLLRDRGPYPSAHAPRAAQGWVGGARGDDDPGPRTPARRVRRDDGHGERGWNGVFASAGSGERPARAGFGGAHRPCPWGWGWEAGHRAPLLGARERVMPLGTHTFRAMMVGRRRPT